MRSSYGSCSPSAGSTVELRTLQRALAPHRQARRAAEVATVRFETAPGHQMQIDFGEKRVVIGGREHARPLLRRRARAIRGGSTCGRSCASDTTIGARGSRARSVHFGGVTQTVLVDNARALVLGRDRRDGRRARASGVQRLLRRLGRRAARLPTVPRAHQGQDRVRRRLREAQCHRGPSFDELRRARGASRDVDDRRRPARFTARRTSDLSIASSARSARRYGRCLRRPLPVRSSACLGASRRTAFVDVDTVRYSVPHRLVRRTVEVLVGDDEVVIFDGARGRRATSSRSRAVSRVSSSPVTSMASCGHAMTVAAVTPILPHTGARLDDYAAVVAGAA